MLKFQKYFSCGHWLSGKIFKWNKVCHSLLFILKKHASPCLNHHPKAKKNFESANLNIRRGSEVGCIDMYMIK